MNRSFVRSTLDADHRTSAYKITCFQCGLVDKVVAASHSGSLPPEITIKKFKQRGWAVGNRAGADLCVACVTRNRLARKAPATITIAALPAPLKPSGIVLPDLTEQPPEKLLTIKEAYDLGWCAKDRLYDRVKSGELPTIRDASNSLLVKETDLIRLFKAPKGIRKYTVKKTAASLVNELKPLVNDGVIKMAMLSIDVMTKEDRRIIFSEIDSHYLDEKRGYAKDWDDLKVATGLKVLVEWVRTIREDNFGPEKGNGIDDEVEKLRVASVEAQKIIDTMRSVWKEMDATLATYEEKQTELSEEANKISKAIAEAKAAIDAATRK